MQQGNEKIQSGDKIDYHQIDNREKRLKSRKRNKNDGDGNVGRIWNDREEDNGAHLLQPKGVSRESQPMAGPQQRLGFAHSAFH